MKRSIPQHEPPPQLFAVVDPSQQNLVLARGFSKPKATGYAQGRRKRHGKGSARVVPDPVIFVPAENIMGDAPKNAPVATIPPPVTLPPLVCGIFRDGKLTRITELADPREGYCWSFNQLMHGEATARPLDSDEVPIARKLLAEREKGGAA